MHGTLAMLSRTPQGRYYVLRVPGVTQSTLSDADLAEVLNWSIARVQRRRRRRRRCRQFTAAEIATARRQPLLEVSTTHRAKVLRETP